MNILPASWNNAISQYLPDARRPLDVRAPPRAHTLRPWPGFALFAGYTALAVAIAAVLLVRRDT